MRTRLHCADAVRLAAPARRAGPYAPALVRALVLAALLPCAEAMADASFVWPGGERAAVSLAYDDALASQLDVALPALDRHGFKASFYLTLSSDTVASRLADWRAAAANGHELGNHTLFHPCSATPPGREWVMPHRDLDTIPAARMVEEVALANTMLAAIDGRTERTFAVPCGDAIAAGEDYVRQVAPAFVAVRRGKGGAPVNPLALDLKAVPVLVPVGASGAELIAMVERARDNDGLASLTFHGIGGDHLPVSIEAHDALLAYLAAHRDIYRVDTFINLMRHVRARQAPPSPLVESP